GRRAARPLPGADPGRSGESSLPRDPRCAAAASAGGDAGRVARDRLRHRRARRAARRTRARAAAVYGLTAPSPWGRARCGRSLLMMKATIVTRYAWPMSCSSTEDRLPAHLAHPEHAADDREGHQGDIRPEISPTRPSEMVLPSSGETVEIAKAVRTSRS